jgi:O-antigen/teichoic acid export membrane protein
MFSAPFIMLNFLIQISFQVLAGIWKVRKRAEILVVVLIINIILNLLLIPMLWVNGSALAVSLSWIPLYFMSLRATGLQLPIFGEKSWYKNLATWLWAFYITHILWQKLWGNSVFLEIFLAILIYLAIFSMTNRKLMKEAFDTIKDVRKGKNPQQIVDTSLPI